VLVDHREHHAALDCLGASRRRPTLPSPRTGAVASESRSSDIAWTSPAPSSCSLAIVVGKCVRASSRRPFGVPLLNELAAAVLVDEPVDRRFDGRRARASRRSSPSRICWRAPVDDLALLVHHLVVLEHILADLEVAPLRPCPAHARLLSRPSSTRAATSSSNDLSITRLHQTGGEQPHQLVLERQVESGSPPGRPGRPARPRSWLSIAA